MKMYPFEMPTPINRQHQRSVYEAVRGIRNLQIIYLLEIRNQFIVVRLQTLVQ